MSTVIEVWKHIINKENIAKLQVRRAKVKASDSRKQDCRQHWIFYQTPYPDSSIMAVCRMSGSPGSNASTLRLRRLMSMRPMWTMLKSAVMIMRHTPSSTPIRTLTGNIRYVSRNRLPLRGRTRCFNTQVGAAVIQHEGQCGAMNTVEDLLFRSRVPATFLMKQNLLVMCWTNTAKRIMSQKGLKRHHN